ncbi:hypothetical protein NKG05_00165 [Oerskovia sp. M15]
MAPEPAPIAPISAAVTGKLNGEPESATGMLQLAQKLHDDYVRSGQQEGDRLIAEAKEEGTRIVQEAEETSHRTLSQLEQERSLLERKIDELRLFERDYRTRLKSYLQNLMGTSTTGAAHSRRAAGPAQGARATSARASSPPATWQTITPGVRTSGFAVGRSVTTHHSGPSGVVRCAYRQAASTLTATRTGGAT